MTQEQISLDLVQDHGLTLVEYERICRLLGREPNLTELGIFSVMWSEHCSYKSSRLHLSNLPTEAPWVLQGPGENAGVVDIGGEQVAVFKIESHNHPSFIEPYQGAATGVGGILRDIFTMGARPVAIMNSLHFGPLEKPHNQLIIEGVVSGIAGYGNCMGIPTVGGELCFQEHYSRNPIVNVFSLGIAQAGAIFKACASGVGNPIIYVGAKTGRDGIHGATMASEQFSQDSRSKRPNVQIGDPFLEKLLLEACLEAMASGAVVGIQDMGAAGLTCSTCEMGNRAGMGIEIDLALVPQREEQMTPYEIMLSESQERMLLVAHKGRDDELLRIFRKWDLDAVVVGRVRREPELMVCHGKEKIAQIPTRALTDEAPVYDRPTRKPQYLSSLPRWQDLSIGEPSDYEELFLKMVASPHLCSRAWVYRQYDHMVRTNTVVTPGSDAAVLRLKAQPGALAMSLDGNSRFCQLDPRMGAMLAVAESCRNLVCSGARPLAATNCLNFASPENPEVMWQFTEAVGGMGEACRHFGTPITGGNVSFYNETNGVGIFPTPVVGMVGKIDHLRFISKAFFQNSGDTVYLLGETRPELGGSIYLETLGISLSAPCPQLDLVSERRLQDDLLRISRAGLIESAHDLSEGGLLTALAECCFEGHLAVSVKIEAAMRSDYFLFSESPSRALVSVRKTNEVLFLEAVESPVAKLGEIREGDFHIMVNGQTLISLAMEGIVQLWDSSLGEVFNPG